MEEGARQPSRTPGDRPVTKDSAMPHLNTCDSACYFLPFLLPLASFFLSFHILSCFFSPCTFLARLLSPLPLYALFSLLPFPPVSPSLHSLVFALLSLFLSFFFPPRRRGGDGEKEGRGRGGG